MSHPLYEDINAIAKGTFGDCTLVRRRRDGKSFVKKNIELAKLKHPVSKASLTDFGNLVRLRHPNLARLREALIVGSAHSSMDDQMVVILDFVEGGFNLAKAVEKRILDGRPFSEMETTRVFLQIVLALKALHDSGVCHGNLKPENVFLEGPAFPANGRTLVKVCDFGLCSFFGTAGTPRSLPYYTAPEQTKEGATDEIIFYQFATSADVWSLGCIVFEMIMLRKPFLAPTHYALQLKKQESATKIAAEKGRSPAKKLSPLISHNFQDLVSQMLDVDPSRRPSVNSILLLPFLQPHLEDLISSNASVSSRMLEASPEISRASGAGNGVPLNAKRFSPNITFVGKPKPSVNGRKPSSPPDLRTGDTFPGVSDESIRLALESEQEAFQSKQKIIRSPRVSNSPPPRSIKTEFSGALSPNSPLSPTQITAANSARRRAKEREVSPPSVFNAGGQNYRERVWNEKRDKQAQHEAVLAKARIAAFEERKRLAAKMRQVGGRPVRAGDVGTGTPQALPAAARQSPGFSSAPGRNPRQRRETAKERKEREYKEALAKARKEAFEERKALQEKMQTVGGRPARVSSRGAHSSSPPESHGDTNVAPAVGQRSSRDGRTSRKAKEEEDYMKALAKARKEAYDERMALQRRMSNVGGRPALRETAASTAFSSTQEGKEGNASNARALQRSASQDYRLPNSPARNAKARAQQRKDAEREARLEELTRARKEAFQERMNLQRRMSDYGSRPQPMEQNWSGGSAHQQNSATPFAIDESVEKITAAEAASRRRVSMKTKQAQEEEYKAALEAARRTAFAERQRLKQKYGR